VVTGTEVLAATGLAQTDNVFAVDLRATQRRIEQLPWVKRAVVVRRPPDRLAIGLIERRRVAWVNLGGIYGIDEGGVLLPGERTPGEEPSELNLPVISGLTRAEGATVPGTVVADSGLAQVLGWWRQASQADAEFCLNVSEIQPLPGDGVRLLLVGDGLEVRLPTGDVAERLRILRKLIKRVYRECADPAYIDMRFAGQVVVGSKEQVVGSKEQNPG
jgi:cell division septal protein FtsQ